MGKNHAIKRSSKTGQFVTGSLGKAKASKFSMIEGIALNGKSTRTMRRLEASGLKGDDLRAAISESFQKKRG